MARETSFVRIGSDGGDFGLKAINEDGNKLEMDVKSLHLCTLSL
jgi:hypothetical protein